MDDFELELKTTFIDEALLNLEETESCFMELESSPDKKTLLDRIFRLAHNLKGGSRSVGFGDIAEFTHELESFVLALQNDRVQLSAQVVSTLLHCNDRLVEMMTALKADINARCDNTDLLAQLRDHLAGKASPPATPQPEAAEAPEAEPSFEDMLALDAEPAPPTPVGQVVTEVAKTAPPPKTATASSSKSDKEDEMVRVNLSRIELLNDYVGELIVLQSVIQQQAMANDTVKLHSSIQQMIKLSKDIQNLSMGLRMLPVKPLVQKLQRVVRDTAASLSKNVFLDLVGEQIDVDKSVLERLADPLIHILRNAVDHGLELPEDRVASGKPAQGRVKLCFYNEGNHLIVEVKDDGKGIDSQILQKKAVAKGLIAAEQVMSEKQLINLIFHPGFSTKEQVTEVSGRGVGMDVVKTNIEKIGGQIDITTAVGVGSTFKIKIPLSLAVIDGLVTSTKSGRYVIPLSQVQETVNLKSSKIHTDKQGIGDCLDIRGQVVPIYRLQKLIDPKASDTDNSDSTALLFNVDDRLVAVSVRELSHSQQVVIKPLTNGIKAQVGWVGSCVLGDGLPTLIVSPLDLLAGKIESSRNNERRMSA